MSEKAKEITKNQDSINKIFIRSIEELTRARKFDRFSLFHERVLWRGKIAGALEKIVESTVEKTKIIERLEGTDRIRDKYGDQQMERSECEEIIAEGTI